MAAIVALLLSGHHLKAMLIPIALLAGFLAVVRIVSRKARNRAYEQMPVTPVREWGYQGRRRVR